MNCDFMTNNRRNHAVEAAQPSPLGKVAFAKQMTDEVASNKRSVGHNDLIRFTAFGTFPIGEGFGRAAQRRPYNGVCS